LQDFKISFVVDAGNKNDVKLPICEASCSTPSVKICFY